MTIGSTFFNFATVTLCLYFVTNFQISAYEKAAREQKMRTEISQAKKEANFYIENVEKSKIIDAIEKRKGKKHKMVDSQSELDKV